MSENPGCPHQAVCSTVPAQAHFRAVAELSGLSALRAFTLNHRTLGLDALPAVALSPHELSALQHALSEADVEAIVLATCNRFEIYWRARVPGDDEKVRQLVQARLREPAHELLRRAVVLRGAHAATHLFRVCCGIESLVLGEAEILGQVRTALETSAAGPFLQGVLQAGLRAGRMARAETTIAVGALSVASAAVQLVAAMMPLERSRIVVVGAGATGLKAARHFRALGAGQLAIVNRTQSKAAVAAPSIGAQALPMEALADELDTADAVVCAVASPSHVISLDALRAAAARRGQRPLMIVDLSMPPVVEPGDAAGVTRVDLGALEQQVARQRDRREAEIPRVEDVISREVTHLKSWARHQALRPLVSDLRRKVERIRRTELERAARELDDNGGTDVTVLDRLSKRLLEQVLAIPLATLEAGELPLDPAQAQYLRRLFALDPGAGA